MVFVLFWLKKEMMNHTVKVHVTVKTKVHATLKGAVDSLQNILKFGYP
jgi:hypothetical protein